MFEQTLDVMLKGRWFTITSLQIVIKDDDDETIIYAFRITEGDKILNEQELRDKTFDFYDRPEEAVDGGFSWLKKHM